MSDWKSKELTKALAGKTVIAVVLAPDGEYLFLGTTEGDYTLKACGDCCAHAYIESADDYEYLVGRTIVEVVVRDFSSEGAEYDVVDTEFYSIKTQDFDLDIELRTEHNGYYGGTLELYKVAS